jgi:transglycosylase-like protein with SLT domain
MIDQDAQDHRHEPRPFAHGRRTRVAVALIGFLFSMGMPVAVLGSGPVPTVDGHAIGSLADPAGLGVTGALPGNPLPSGPSTGDAVPAESPTGARTGVPGDSASAALPGIPTPPNLPDGPLGIPGVVLDAYQFAQRTLTATRPGCHLSWPVLAGIGRIESGHASGGRVDAFGNTLGPILGPRLDGSLGVAAIADTDHGQLDGDSVWDRAVGPMQFIPSTWRSWGVDGNGDGVANPNNIYDSAITTGLYLCAGGADLADPARLQAAVFRYNHSATYVDIVLRWAQAYLTDAIPTPSAPGPVPPGINGNGGRPIPADAPLAVPPPAAASPIVLASKPVASSSGSPTPPPLLPTTTTPVPTATGPATTSPSPPAATTTPPPVATTTTLPPTTAPAASPPPPPLVTPPPAVESSSAPSPSPVPTTPLPTTTSSPLLTGP